MAVVHTRSTEKRHYLKLVRPSRRTEIDIISYLASHECPENHVVRPVAFRDCDLGTLLLLPDAGVAVDNYAGRPDNLLSVASQFLHAVAFLHSHKVAHCDIKPSHVVVDLSTGHLTLIDFDVAVRGHDWLENYRGTDDWTAPEIGNVDRYDPLCADVWATGKVLDAICENCGESVDRDFLLGLSKVMMAPEPEARPSMKRVVEMFERYAEGHGGLKLSSAGAENSALQL